MKNLLIGAAAALSLAALAASPASAATISVSACTPGALGSPCAPGPTIISGPAGTLLSVPVTTVGAFSINGSANATNTPTAANFQTNTIDVTTAAGGFVDIYFTLTGVTTQQLPLLLSSTFTSNNQSGLTHSVILSTWEDDANGANALANQLGTATLSDAVSETAHVNTTLTPSALVSITELYEIHLAGCGTGQCTANLTIDLDASQNARAGLDGAARRRPAGPRLRRQPQAQRLTAHTTVGTATLAVPTFLGNGLNMKRLLLTTTIALAVATPAIAGPITTTNDSIPIGEIVNLTNIRPINGVIAGQNVFQVSGGGTIDAWCIDMFHEISLGNNSYSFTQGTLSAGASDGHGNTLTATQVERMAGLMEVGNGILQGGALASANAHYGISGATLTDWSAAIQLAIWDVEYAQNFFATLAWSGGAASPPWPGGTALAQTIYADLINDTSITGDASDLVAEDGQQSFAYSTLSISLLAAPVPEPASLALFGVSVLGLGFVARKRSV